MAGKIGKPCRESRCSEIVEGSEKYCEKHRRLEFQNAFNNVNKERLDFYGSSRWQRIRKLKLAQTPICEVCNRRIATQVHHLHKARDNPDQRYEMENLQSICIWCHARETQRETTAKRLENATERHGNSNRD